MKIKRGSTSVRRLIFIGDSSSTTGAGLTSLVYNSAGLVAYYFAGDLSNELVITLATATLGTYTSGGFIAVDNTNMPGWYEIGIPNAALDAGNEVAIQLRGATNMVPVNIYIELDTVDYQTAAFGAMLSYTQPTGFLTATFPTTIASTTNITAATVDATKIGGSTVAATQLSLSAGVIIPGTVSTAVLSPTTSAFASDDITEATADHYLGRSLIFTSGALQGQATRITGYSLVSAEGNFAVVALTEAPANNDTFIIV